MANNKFFEKLAKQIKRSKRGIKNRRIINPVRDWFIGLFFSVIGLVFIGLWSAETYISHRELSEADSSGRSEQPIIYRESLVEEALSQYAERLRQHELLLSQNATSEPEVENGEGDEEDAETSDGEASEETITVPDDTPENLRRE